MMWLTTKISEDSEVSCLKHFLSSQGVRSVTTQLCLSSPPLHTLQAKECTGNILSLLNFVGKKKKKKVSYIEYKCPKLSSKRSSRTCLELYRGPSSYKDVEAVLCLMCFVDQHEGPEGESVQMPAEESHPVFELWDCGLNSYAPFLL